MKKILIIDANYYKNITASLVLGAKKVLYKYKLKTNVINVPGIF